MKYQNSFQNLYKLNAATMVIGTVIILGKLIPKPENIELLRKVIIQSLG